MIKVILSAIWVVVTIVITLSMFYSLALAGEPQYMWLMCDKFDLCN